MKLGFTGTREGMSALQKNQFRSFLTANCPNEFHHGDCIGADLEAHRIVQEVCPSCSIHVHPADIPKFRAFARGGIIHPIRPTLERNKIIVDSSDHMFAAPKGIEERRSGTWMTIRYARRKLRELTIAERSNGV